MVRVRHNLDNLGDQVAAVIASELLHEGQDDESCSRQGLATLRSLVLLNRLSYETYRPHLIKDLSISNKDLNCFLTLMRREPEALREVHHLALVESPTSSRSSKSKAGPNSSSHSRPSKSAEGYNARTLLENRKKKEKEKQLADIEVARSLSSTDFPELPPDETLEEKNITSPTMRKSSQITAFHYMHAGRGLLIDGMKDLKSLKVNDLKSFGFPFIKRTVLVKNLVKPPVLDANVMGMGMKGRENTIERLEIPTTVPLDGLSNLVKLDLNHSNSFDPVSGRDLSMTNATWILSFLPYLREAHLGITMDKNDADLINEAIKASKDLAGISNVKSLELNCLVLSKYKVSHAHAEFVPSDSSDPIDEKSAESKTHKSDGLEEMAKARARNEFKAFLPWTNDSEKALALKNFLNLTKNLVGLSLSILHEPPDPTQVESDKKEKKTEKEPTISIESIRKGVTNSFSTIKNLLIKGVHFPTKSELDLSSRKSKTKFKSPFVSFLALENLALDHQGLKSLEPQSNYPDMPILIYFPPKLKSLEMLINVGFGDEDQDEIPNLSTSDPVTPSTNGVAAKVNGNADGEGEANEGEGNDGQSVKKSKKKKKKGKTASATETPTSTPTPTPTANPTSKAKPSKESIASSIQSLAQNHYFMESKITSLLIRQNQVQSPDSLPLPKNFQTLITPSRPVAISDHLEEKDGGDEEAFDIWGYGERLHEEKIRKEGKVPHQKTLGEKELDGPLAKRLREEFKDRFLKNRDSAREKLKGVNGGIELKTK